MQSPRGAAETSWKGRTFNSSRLAGDANQGNNQRAGDKRAKEGKPAAGRAFSVRAIYVIVSLVLIANGVVVCLFMMNDHSHSTTHALGLQQLRRISPPGNAMGHGIAIYTYAFTWKLACILASLASMLCTGRGTGRGSCQPKTWILRKSATLTTFFASTTHYSK